MKIDGRNRRIAILGLLLGTLVGSMFSLAEEKSQEEKTDIFSETKKFAEIYRYIQRMYYRPVNRQVLLSGAIEGMLQIVDRNDVFLAASTDQLGEQPDGEIPGQGVGLIVGFGKREPFGSSVPVVLVTLPGSPADKAGIRKGSVIWQVDDKVVAMGELLGPNLYDMLNQPAGEKVKLVLFDPVAGRREVEVESGDLTVSSKIEERRVKGEIPLVHFPLLVSESTVSGFEASLARLEESGALDGGLILDLRGSCLGEAQQGYALADLLLRDGPLLGKVLVQRKGEFQPKRGDRGEQILYYAGDHHAWLDFPVVVIVDGTTAGAAEIMAATLGHWDRARLVGRTSFGYAPFRQRFLFDKGAQITLTTGLYSTTDDQVFMGEGVTPHVKVTVEEGSAGARGVSGGLQGPPQEGDGAGREQSEGPDQEPGASGSGPTSRPQGGEETPVEPPKNVETRPSSQVSMDADDSGVEEEGALLDTTDPVLDVAIQELLRLRSNLASSAGLG